MLAVFTTFLPLILQVVTAIPAIQKAWESSTGNSIQAVATVVQALPPAITAQLAEVGAQLFPKLSPELHAAAAALIVAHPNNTAWTQSAINLLASTGYITLAKPLTVDGVYGAHTQAAIIAVQTKMGLPANGILLDAEFTMITQLLAKA